MYRRSIVKLRPISLNHHINFVIALDRWILKTSPPVSKFGADQVGSWIYTPRNEMPCRLCMPWCTCELRNWDRPENRQETTSSPDWINHWDPDGYLCTFAGVARCCDCCSKRRWCLYLLSLLSWAFGCVCGVESACNRTTYTRCKFHKVLLEGHEVIESMTIFVICNC